MMKARGLLLTVILGVLPHVAHADDYIPPVVGGQTYTQHQIVSAKAKHPGILSITVDGVGDAGKPGIVLGSTADAGAVMKPVAKSAAKDGGMVGAGGKTYVVREPFLSNTDHRIGTIVVTFAYKAGQDEKPLMATAKTIATQMSKITLSAKNAADPYPYDEAYGPTTYAQTLTEKTVARHPDLLVMMIHATPPGKDKNLIIGSNIGRFGKIADEDDARVIDKGSTNLEIGGDNDRFETELPLNDAKGQRIGALGLVFKYKPGEDKEAIHRHGLAIRDEIATQIPENAALFKPK